MNTVLSPLLSKEGWLRRRRRRGGKTTNPQAGFSLAAVICFATAASIALAVAVPSYQMQAKREIEAELIFRGEEYARAIQKYQRRFNGLPPSVEALLQTNGLRFLRRQYKDPVSDKEFRLITIDGNGTVNGSNLMNQRIGNQPLFGGRGQTFGETSPQQLQGLQQLQQNAQQFGTQQTMQQQQQQQQTQRQQQPPQQRGATSGDRTRVQGQPQQGITTGVMGSAGIIGVGSDSEGESIKVYNQRQKYNEWEFVALLGQPNQQQQQPGQQTPPGGGQQNPFGGAQQNPLGSGQQSPFGGQQTPFGGGQQSPFGGQQMQPPNQQRNPNQPPVQNPFGFGPPPQPQQPGKRPPG